MLALAIVGAVDGYRRYPQFEGKATGYAAAWALRLGIGLIAILVAQLALVLLLPRAWLLPVFLAISLTEPLLVAWGLVAAWFAGRAGGLLLAERSLVRWRNSRRS